MPGWVKLHRKLLENPVFTDSKLLQIFIYCLLKANRKPNKFLFNKQVIELKEGQFVSGGLQAKKDMELKSKMWYRKLELLEKLKVVTRQMTNKFSIITVNNWKKYQENDTLNDNQMTIKKTPTTFRRRSTFEIRKGKSPKNDTLNDRQNTDSNLTKNDTLNDNQMTIKRQSNDNQMTTNKNDKNDKNNILMCSQNENTSGIKPLLAYFGDKFKTFTGFDYHCQFAKDTKLFKSLVIQYQKTYAEKTTDFLKDCIDIFFKHCEKDEWAKDKIAIGLFYSKFNHILSQFGEERKQRG